ncbi:hypothetical protein [Bradyrhizobium phage BDU-MI-1]|nr:hypothetical protein [Bradyrhizobium phage BDU-MI-1]
MSQDQREALAAPGPSWIDLGPGGSHLPYRSLSDGVRDNARRHLRNAGRYLAAGNPDYALGSLRKAARNWQKAQEIDDICSGRLR